MGLFSKYNKTNFEGGGLMIEEVALSDPQIYRADKKFVAPRKIDSRDMCLASSNQGSTPHCVGYSTAGFCEIEFWKRSHYPKQISGDDVYKEAKKLDGRADVGGTWLRFGVQAALNLGVIKGEPKKIPTNKNDLKFALHEYGAAVCAFMITNEWNQVNKKNGMIRDLGDKAKTRGGHAVLCVGYDDSGVYIQNSWGSEWGIHGFCILPWKLFDKQFKNAMVIKT